MSLKDFNKKYDYKNNLSYLGIYDNLLKNKNVTNILQIGDNDSIKLWSKCFSKSNIYVIQSNESNNSTSIVDIDNVKYYYTNPYDNIFINQINQIQFDLLLCNGKNNDISTIKMFIEFYLPLLNNGLFIIEDIKNIDWLDILISTIPDKYKKSIKTFDLREVNKSSHDILFIIDTKMETHSNSTNMDEIILSNKQNEIIEPLDVCLVINTCKSNSSNINDYFAQS